MIGVLPLERANMIQTFITDLFDILLKNVWWNGMASLTLNSDYLKCLKAILYHILEGKC